MLHAVHGTGNVIQIRGGSSSNCHIENEEKSLLASPWTRKIREDTVYMAALVHRTISKEDNRDVLGFPQPHMVHFF
jgi:hypothetical protein